MVSAFWCGLETESVCLTHPARRANIAKSVSIDQEPSSRQQWIVPLIEQVSFARRSGAPKGTTWRVTDDEQLARSIAQIAIGQWDHLERMLQSGVHSEVTAGYSLAGAKRTLHVPEDGPDWMIWHRDGWVFQAISWIAAVEAGRGPARPPHIAHADKGFDGLQLLLTRDGSRAKRLIIFEDKATTNPRGMIRGEVWPALEILESGGRDHELRSELLALLLRAPGLDTVQAVDRLLNQTGHRSYRVAVTIGRTHDSAAGIKRLFEGYSGAVPGRRFRRRAHVLRQDELRNWLARIAELAVRHIEELETRRTKESGSV